MKHRNAELKASEIVDASVVMNITPRFLRFGAVCVMLTALTTLVVHWVPDLWANVTTFEQRLDLRLNPIYITRLWVVIVHCLLVIVSMFALGLTKIRNAPALVTFGFLSYVIFSFTEILRTSLSLFALNRAWRAGYAAATDESVREGFRVTIGAFPGINDALFFIFFLAFALGTLCYGLALLKTEGPTATITLVFLFWAATGLPGLIDTIRGATSLGPYFEWVGYYFLPLARAYVGVWFWKNADRLAVEIDRRT